MKKYAISRLTKQGTVGTAEEDEDQNGTPYTKFKPSFATWYGEYQVNDTALNDYLTDQVQKIIVIRHNPNIKTTMQFKTAEDETLDITSIQSDSSVNGFDVITLGTKQSSVRGDSSSDDSSMSGGYDD